MLLMSVIWVMGCSPPAVDDTNEGKESSSSDVIEGYASPSLWSIQQLEVARAKGENVLLVDLRKTNEFAEGHLPGARRIWREDIQSENYPYGGMAGEREMIEALMDSLGATSQSQVIIYDAKGGCDAARFWWLLKSYGHPKAALLDGGWQAWVLSGRQVDTLMSERPITMDFRFSEPEQSIMWIKLDQMLEQFDDSSIVLLDTRSEEEYSGAQKKKGATRAGRIPRSVHYDWGNSVRMGQDWLLKPENELRNELEARGITPDKNIVVYCHTGVRSAHTTFVLRELLGFENVWNYDGSWTEWSYMTDLPIETDQEEPIN